MKTVVYYLRNDWETYRVILDWDQLKKIVDLKNERKAFVFNDRMVDAFNIISAELKDSEAIDRAYLREKWQKKAVPFGLIKKE